MELHKFRHSLGQFSAPDPEEEIVTSYKTQVAMKKVNKRRNSMLLPFQPLTLTFLNVQYYVDMPAVNPPKPSKVSLWFLNPCVKIKI